MPDQDRTPSGSATAFDWDEAERDLMEGIDTTVPHSARIWDYWAGGKDNYRVDQEAGDQFAAIYPGIADTVRAARYFSARLVRYLAEERRISQFLEIGVGMPGEDGGSVHEIAQKILPEARVVYVDNDPLVLAHARALLTGTPPSSTDVIDGDVGEPDTILKIAQEKLDFSQPVAISLMGVVRHIAISDRSDRAARTITARFRDALPAGGCLAVYDCTDTDFAFREAVRLYNEGGSAPWHLRSPDQIAGLLDGLELIDPGVVPVTRWRPAPDPFDAPAADAWGGVGRKSSWDFRR